MVQLSELLSLKTQNQPEMLYISSDMGMHGWMDVGLSVSQLT